MMKHSKFWIGLALCISLLSIGVSVYLGHKVYLLEHVNSFEDLKYTSSDISEVYVPDTLDLANELLPLHRRDVFEALQKELIVNTYLHSHTIQFLKKSPSIFSLIVPILKEEGVPEDFKYLAVIESQLNPRAMSYAGAVGLWQFLANTGKEYGLEITEQVDERYSIEASTRAAAKYLKKAYSKYGSWTLAAASYNSGLGRISRSMKDQQENSFYDLLLSEETTRYIYRIVALKQIMNNPEKYGFFVNKVYKPEGFNYIEVNKSIPNFTKWSKEHGITYKTLKDFNPWLRKDNLIVAKGKKYRIKIPTEREQYIN